MGNVDISNFNNFLNGLPEPCKDCDNYGKTDVCKSCGTHKILLSFYEKWCKEEDKQMFSMTKWSGMSFTMDRSWYDFCNDKERNVEYASPIFTFENGDKVVIDRQGNFKEL